MDHGVKRGVNLLQADQRFLDDNVDVLESRLGHGLGGEVPVVHYPCRGGGDSTPVTARAVEPASIVA